MDYVGLTLWVSKSEYLGEKLLGGNYFSIFPSKGYSNAYKRDKCKYTNIMGGGGE